ncbi:hypothetical protein DXG03_004489 [Asterophora parasitica]|uniref:Uncharacterized protein n=1 Tax=Asterophora parasitica TaxID=117018 RepID=A0A9P7KFP5_9AGAR|nr:hypothetical protein DXG03_004489 [Asterophora parasitica]
MVFHTDLHRFVTALQERLGPQIQNVPLLYQGTPELKDVLGLFGISIAEPTEHPSTKQLRARFQSLVENVFSIIAETRLFALFLDDLHEADESTLDLVSTLLNSRSRMVTEVALMMDWEISSGGEDETDDMWNLHKARSNLRDKGSSSSTRGSMRGLQLALAEGWLIQRARDMCSFAHDRYRQAAQMEADALPQDAIAKMSFRIILMMLHEIPTDVYRIAEHAKHCLLLLHENPKREELLNVLMDAGESAWERGAHELAIRSFLSARTLLHKDPWEDNPGRTYALLSRLAALFTWKGDCDASNTLLEECYAHAQEPEARANILRLRSRNHFLSNDIPGALKDTLLALKVLGVDINPAPTEREADTMFELIKNEILAVGFDAILMIPRATDPKIELAVSLLNDAGVPLTLSRLCDRTDNLFLEV